MKRLLLLILIFILTIASFADSELDSLLKDDEDIFAELASDDSGLEAKDAYVEELLGQAFLQHEESGKWLQIIEDTKIKEKDTIITMEDTAMKVRMEDETYINIGERTKIYFETLRGKPEEELISETGLKLVWGKVFSKVRKRVESGGKYEIEAGSVVAGVRGTGFGVEAIRDPNARGGLVVSVSVFEGLVAVREREDRELPGGESGSTPEELLLGENEEVVGLGSEDGFEIIELDGKAPENIEDMNNNDDDELSLPEASVPTDDNIGIDEILDEVESDVTGSDEERGSTGGPGEKVYLDSVPR